MCPVGKHPKNRVFNSWTICSLTPNSLKFLKVCISLEEQAVPLHRNTFHTAFLVPQSSPSSPVGLFILFIHHRPLTLPWIQTILLSGQTWWLCLSMRAAQFLFCSVKINYCYLFHKHGGAGWSHHKQWRMHTGNFYLWWKKTGQCKDKVGRAGANLTVALRAWMLWARGKPMDVRMEMLSSGGEFPMGAAPVGLSLVEGPGSIREGKIRGSAKSDMI